jgi:hypothetical protein
MVRVGSLFSQLLHEFPRNEFAALVREHDAERGAKGFSCWTQFVAMAFCHLAGADSLRQICYGLRSCLGKLRHLGVSGVDQAPNKSTLSYANSHRPAELFEALFFSSLARFRELGRIGCRKPKFRFKNPLLSLDSTVISLCLNLFPWARFRRAKGGVKAHVLLDHDDYMPRFVWITEARQADIRVAREVDLPAGSIVAMDRGYNDFRLFSEWTAAGVYFVTRLKEGTVYEVLENRVVPQNSSIREDQTIRLTGARAVQVCGDWVFRRVVVWDEKNEREIVLLSNHLEFGATTLAAIYKDRWEIELFFKVLKQSLKVKTFVGTSENALRIQIWTAMIALLLLKWLHHLSRAAWSFTTLARLLRLNLMTYRTLRDWLDRPLDTPPLIPGPQQIALPLAGFGQPDSVAA